MSRHVILSLFFSGNAVFPFFSILRASPDSWVYAVFQTSCVPVSTSKGDLILVRRPISRFSSIRSCQMKTAESGFRHFCPVNEVKIGFLVIFGDCSAVYGQNKSILGD